MKIGFAGLGNMGAAMAKRLVAAGNEVTVYNRTAEKTRPLQTIGARVVSRPRDLGDCDFIVTMLTDDLALKEVACGENGFASAMRPGSIHVAMGTISVALSKEMDEIHRAAAQGYVAAPVLGRPDAAGEGKLFILAAGESALLRRCESWMGALGQKVFTVGDQAWKAHLMKLACNFLILGSVEAMAEAFALTGKGGIDSSAFFDVFSTTIFASPVYQGYGRRIAEGKFSGENGFRIPTALKDARLVLQAGDDLGVPMPTASLARDRLLQALTQGLGGADLSALSQIAAETAGIKK